MQHLEEGTIHAWLDGALSGDEAERVEAHVRQCAECAAAVGEARGLIAGASRIVSALDVVPGGVIPHPKSAPAASAPKSLWRVLHFTPSRAAIAATLLVAVGSMFVLPYAVPHGDKRTPNLERVVVSPTAALPPSAPPPQAQAQQAQAASDARNRATDVAKVAEQKKESRADTPVAEVVVADAAGSAVRDSARPVVADSARAMSARAMSAAGVSAEASRREAPRAAPLRVLDQSEPAPALIGCFRAAEDPARLGIALPLRFSLDRDTSGNVLRKLDDSGRAESVVGEWRQTSATSVLITLVNRDQRTVVSLTRDGSGGLAVEAPSLGSRPPAGVSSRSISVSRMDCVR